MINIIIPYFNASDTIERALHSIAMQTTYRKVIVTIVDDCSDEEIEYFDEKKEMMVKDCTYHFLHNSIFPKFQNLNINYLRTDSNQGPGAARNLGIKNCFCDWIIFLDADDALASPIVIEVINHEIQRKRPDILLTRFQQQTDKLLIDMSLTNRTWMHGKIFKTSFLHKNNILFPEIRGNEDSAFNSIAFAMAEDIKEFDYLSYIWINNKKSLVRSNSDYYGNFLCDYIKGREFVFEYLDSHCKDEIENEILNTLLISYWQFIDIYTFKKELTENYIKELLNYLKLINLPKYIKNEEFIRKLSIRFWKVKHKPHYGPLIPTIGLMDFYESLNSGIYRW